MNNTFVSVIIPTYNYEQYIVQAVESVLAQDYPAENIEIVIVDDGSTDNTKKSLQSFITAGKVSYIYQNNKGKANASFMAIQQCKGKYIFNLDADDYFFPDKISSTVAIFEANENIVHVATPAIFYNDKLEATNVVEALPVDIVGKQIPGYTLLGYFYSNNIFYGSGSTFAARASILKAITIPDAVDMYIDEFLILSILPFGSSFFIQKPLSAWRMHDNNYSKKSVDAAKQIAKEERLLKSSAAVLKYLIDNSYDAGLIKIYRLKDCNRRIALKETFKTKNVKDIACYARTVFFEIKPGWKLIKKYQVINRLLPLSLFLFLKKLSSKQ